MKPFISYLLQSTISISILYLLYKILMSKMSSHSLNRMLLIGMLLGSVCLPFVKFSVIPEAAPLIPLNLLRDFVVPVPDHLGEESTQLTQSGIVEIGLLSFSLMSIYFLTISILFLRFLLGMRKVFRIFRKSKCILSDDVRVFLVRDKIQPFTFMKKIVMSEEDFKTNGELIIAHEKEHIRQNHTFDLILLEVFTLIYWFNPLIYLIRQDLKLIHEYQADRAAINTGIDAHTYQLLVLEKAVGERRFALANQFIQQPLLKRFKMIQKKNQPKWVGLRLLFFVPVILLLLQAFTRPEVLKQISSTTASDQTTSDMPEPDRNLTAPQDVKKSEIFKMDMLHIVDDNMETEGVPNAMKERNVMIILINAKNEFLVENVPAQYKELLVGVDNFLHGKAVYSTEGAAPEFITKSIDGLGNVKISKGVISIQYDRATDQKVIDDLLQDIREKHAVVMDEKSQALFLKKFKDLSSEEKKVMKEIVPLKVAIATPKPPPAPVK